MQVILDSSFARPGSAPIWGGKKGEFRDWTKPGLYRLERGCGTTPRSFCVKQIIDKEKTFFTAKSNSFPYSFLLFEIFVDKTYVLTCAVNAG